MTITLNSKMFIKKENETYKKYRKIRYSIGFARFKSFHDTIDYFRARGMLC